MAFFVSFSEYSLRLIFMQLHLFNPENDLALANGDPNFVAPTSARRLARDLAALPIWWSEPEDLILIGGKTDHWAEVQACAPWGWSPEVKNRFLKLGINESLLPDEQQLEHIRALSHRRTSIEIIRRLAEDGSYPYELPAEPQELFSIADVDSFIRTMDSVVLKTPWSSSGKGLCWSDQVNSFNREQWLKPVFKKIGSVVGERVYEKILDFAMIFSAQADGSVVFAGYSLFDTDTKGAYQGNRLLSNEAIEAILSDYVALSQLCQLERSLIRILSDSISSAYIGYLGVDMMICQTASGYLLHPCVELNLRMTMGAVARLFYDKHTCGGEGRFRIIYQARKGALYDYFLQQELTPAEWEGEKLKSGTLLLTPVDRYTHYVAIAEMDPAL